MGKLWAIITGTIGNLFTIIDVNADTLVTLSKVGNEKSHQFYDEAAIRRKAERKALEASTGVTLE